MTTWYDKRHALWQSCKDLTEEQRAAINDMVKAVDNIIEMISECQDLYLSDIRRLEAKRWELYRLVPTEEPNE